MTNRIKLSDWLDKDGNNQNRLAILCGKSRGSIHRAANSKKGHFVKVNSKGEHFVLPMSAWGAFD